MASHGAKIDAHTTQKALVVQVLKTFSDETGIDTLALQNAIESNDVKQTKKQASDLFYGDAFDNTRRFKIHNDILQGIGHTGIAASYNHKSGHEKLDKRKQDAITVFLQALESMRQTQEIVDSISQNIRHEIQELQDEVTVLEAKKEEIEKKLEAVREINTVTKEIDTKTEEIVELEKQNEEIETRLETAQKNLSDMQDNIKKIQAYTEQNRIEDRHDHMNRHFSIRGLNGTESIFSVSNDEDRIVHYNGHMVAYDTETQELFYEAENPETGKTERINVPPSEQARLWNEAYQKNLIFENERAKITNIWDFFKTRTSKTLKREGLDKLLAGKSEEQKTIIRALQDETKDTTKLIQQKIFERAQLTEKYIELTDKYKTLTDKFNNKELSKEDYNRLEKELALEHNRISSEIEEKSLQIKMLEEVNALLLKEETVEKLDEVINNDKTKTITQEEFDNLVSELKVRPEIRELLIEKLKEHENVTLEIEEEKNSPTPRRKERGFSSANIAQNTFNPNANSLEETAPSPTPNSTENNTPAIENRNS